MACHLALLEERVLALAHRGDRRGVLQVLCCHGAPVMPACNCAITDATPTSIRLMTVYSGDALMCRKAFAEGPFDENLRSILFATYSGVTTNRCSAQSIAQSSCQIGEHFLGGDGV